MAGSAIATTEPRSPDPGASAETAALARLALTELAAAVGGIATTHRGIADRAFTAAGPGTASARALHHTIAGTAYATVAAVVRISGELAARALRARGDRGPAPSATARGAMLIGIVDGLIGDTLEREGSPLAQPVTVRVRGREVVPRRADLAAAFPAASAALVVFLHGLMETEHAWSPEAGGYGERLGRDLGTTPVHLRFNSGRRISESGRSVSALLEELADHWPVPVERIALVGHSMGGLVARSACHHAAGHDAAWVRRVRHVVALGTPHTGAPLAQGVHYAAAALQALPETRALGGFLRRRSGGIHDLRHGSLVDEDWRGRDPHELRRRVATGVPLLDGATHAFVAATLTTSAQHPLGRLLGDLLVLTPSAAGSGRDGVRRVAFDAANGAHVGGVHHLALLNHPAVYQRLHAWLGAPVGPAPSVSTLP